MSAVCIRHTTASDSAVIAKMLSHLAEDLGDGDVFSTTAEIIAEHGFGAQVMFHVVIAERGGEPVGLALYFPQFSTTKGQPGVYVQDLWISAAERGNHIGQQLLAAVATHSEGAWGASYIKLAVYADNPRAKQFYERLGFKENLIETAMIADTNSFNTLRGAT